MQKITKGVYSEPSANTNSNTLNPNIAIMTRVTASKKNNQIKTLMKTLKISSITLSGMAVLSLPAKSFITFDSTVDNEAYHETAIQASASNLDAYDSVISNKKLTLASVEGDSTYFGSDGFQHGFGYDLARNYANTLGVDLKLTNYPTAEDALTAVKLGKADMALTTASEKLKSELSLASINLSCGQDAKLTKNGLHPKVSWSFADSANRIATTASYYICDNKQIKNTAKLANFYNQNLLKDAYNQMHFNEALSDRLPNYRSSFKSHAKKHNHDWQLLVAIGYQESHLKSNATSPTGVQGLMMLTNDTADELGVKNRRDPNQSIQGGARYLEKMKEKFAEVPREDRTWFALASYNMGPYAVKEIQTELRKQGKNDRSWANVYAYMSDHAESNSRYVQCMHYVKNIRSYLESIKLTENT